jgi:hypothetical protein
MKRLVAKIGVVLPVVAALAMLTPGSAYAAAAGVVTGSGTISPGLNNPPAGSLQTFAFTGTATGVFGTTAGSCTISSSGKSDGPEDTVQGAGKGDATCSGAGISASATFSYTRAGGVVVILGTATVNGAPCTLGGAFVFAPTSTNPVTTFTLAGTISCV